MPGEQPLRFAQRLLRRAQPPQRQLPEFVGIAGLLLPDRFRLPQGRRPEDVNLDARQHGSKAAVAAMVGVDVLPAHVRQVLDRGEVLQIVLAQEAQLTRDGFRQPERLGILDHPYDPRRHRVHRVEAEPAPLQALLRSDFRTQCVDLQVELLSPGLQHDAGIEGLDDVAGGGAGRVGSESADVVGVTVRGDDGVQPAAAFLLDIQCDRLE